MSDIYESEPAAKFDRSRQVWACDCQSHTIQVNADGSKTQNNRPGGFLEVKVTLEGICKLCKYYAVRLDIRKIEHYLRDVRFRSKAKRRRNDFT